MRVPDDQKAGVAVCLAWLEECAWELRDYRSLTMLSLASPPVTMAAASAREGVWSRVPADLYWKRNIPLVFEAPGIWGPLVAAA